MCIWQNIAATNVCKKHLQTSWFKAFRLWMCVSVLTSECCKWCQQTVKVCSYSFFRSCQSGNVVGCSAIVHFPEFKKRKNEMMLMSTGADVWVCSSALAFPRSTSIFLDFTIWRTKECECTKWWKWALELVLKRAYVLRHFLTLQTWNVAKSGMFSP